MGRRGPPPKPIEDKKLKGNPGRRPLNENEPDFEYGAAPSAEVKGNKIALAKWNEHAPELIQKGILRKQFQTEFAWYCLQHALCVILWRKIKTAGPELAIAKGYMKALQTADVRRANLGARFGLTASDCSQIKIKPELKDEVADFAKKKGQLLLLNGKKPDAKTPAKNQA